MTILTTTLPQLRKHGACVDGYNKLVRALQGKPFTSEDEERVTHIRFKHEAEIPLEFILDSNGLDDALWALCASNCTVQDARLLAVAFARDAEHLMPEASRAALDVAEQFANGLATSEELAEARSSAYAAWHVEDDADYTACTTYAAYAAYVACTTHDDAANAAARAAYYAACTTHVAYPRQTGLFRRLCQGTKP